MLRAGGCEGFASDAMFAGLLNQRRILQMLTRNAAAGRQMRQSPRRAAACRSRRRFIFA